MGQWSKVFWEGGKKFGRSFSVVEDGIQKNYMEEAGFVDVVVKDFKGPVGNWTKDPTKKELGMYVKLILDTDLEGMVFFLSAFCLWPLADLARLCSVYVECRNGLDT